MTTSPAAAAEPRRRGARINTLLELAGFALLVAFAYACWPPAALAAAGVILVVTSNVRAAAAAPRPARAHWTVRTAQALAALRGGG